MVCHINNLSLSAVIIVCKLDTKKWEIKLGWNHLTWNSFLPTTGTRYYYYSEQRRPFLLFLVAPWKRCQQPWMLVTLCLRSTELLFLLIILTEWVYNPPTSTCLFEDHWFICGNVMSHMSWLFLGTYDGTHYQ